MNSSLGGIMKSDLRAMIAYTAGCAILRSSFSQVMEQQQSIPGCFEGRFDHTYVTIIDTLNGHEAMGTVSGKEISLFHSTEKATIKINLNDTKFTGTISDSKGFNGEVIGRAVKVYDYDEGKYFNYVLHD
jgi:hypothetical protein